MPNAFGGRGQPRYIKQIQAHANYGWGYQADGINNIHVMANGQSDQYSYDGAVDGVPGVVENFNYSKH
jgi:hypothetical protein